MSTHASGRLRTLFLTGIFVAGSAMSAGLQTPLPRDGRDRPPKAGPPRDGLACGTTPRAAARSLAAASSVADGHPVSFEQEPPVLDAAWRGEVRLRDLLVPGDVATLQFHSADPDVEDGVFETWERVETRTVAGRLVSVFAPAWPSQVVERIVADQRHGFDYPSVYWGGVRIPDSDPPITRSVWLRAGSTGLPRAEVTRIDDTVQFASHVVNVVVPEFGDSRLSLGEVNFQAQHVTRRFYEHFADLYDGLAIVPQAVHLSRASAFHQHVRNEVEGVGLEVFDYSSFYGSEGRLKGIETYLVGNIAAAELSNHEIAHQWGHFFDWGRIMGLTRAGHQPESHTPLLFPRETMIGAVLDGDRHVRQVADNAFEIARSGHPIRFHPLELYSMGLLTPDEVPELTVFEDQAQFPARPEPGTALTGSARRVSINDVMAAHGPRKGPVPAEWGLAVVLVSRGALASQAEMDYWNFVAARLEDPARSGTPSHDGFVSFDAATDWRVDLRTRIVPKALPAIEQAFEVDAPRFGQRDCRAVEFADAVPSVFTVRQEVRIEGRVTATDRDDFHQILLRYWKHGETSAQSVRFYDPLSASGRFTPRVLFREGEEGLYLMEVFLFWRGAPPQYARCTLTPVRVVAAAAPSLGPVLSRPTVRGSRSRP